MFKEFLREYIDTDIQLTKKEKIVIFCLVFVIGGIFGWFYEFLFYWMNSGFRTFYWRGANYLPWINIYAYGSFLIIFLTYQFRKKPWLVLLISMISTGILEYCTGYVIYGKLGWIRCWDYNQEILNFGNVNGYICLRSIIVFGISGLILMYGMLPLFIKIAKEFNIKKMLILSILLFSIFFIDNAYNFMLYKYFPIPKASDFYKEKGFNYLYFSD